MNDQLKALLGQAESLLAAATPRPWGTGEHIGEPRALCSTPRGLDSLLGLDRDGMAICASAADSHLIEFAVNTLGVFCESVQSAERRAEEAEARVLAATVCHACRGKGTITKDCRFCGDSTYDHTCDDGEVQCYDCKGSGGTNPAGRALLDRLDVAEAKVVQLEAEREVLRGSRAALESDRELLGMIVRDVWITWAQEQPVVKPSWLVPWDQLSEPDKEVDRRIGERLTLMVQIELDALRAALAHEAAQRAELAAEVAQLRSLGMA